MCKTLVLALGLFIIASLAQAAQPPSIPYNKLNLGDVVQMNNACGMEVTEREGRTFMRMFVDTSTNASPSSQDNPTVEYVITEKNMSNDVDQQRGLPEFVVYKLRNGSRYVCLHGKTCYLIDD